MHCDQGLCDAIREQRLTQLRLAQFHHSACPFRESLAQFCSGGPVENTLRLFLRRFNSARRRCCLGEPKTRTSATSLRLLNPLASAVFP
jgi:hypothetical protein